MSIIEQLANDWLHLRDHCQEMTASQFAGMADSYARRWSSLSMADQGEVVAMIAGLA